MKNYFRISEFNKTGRPIPEGVADKILLHHILPMNEVRHTIGEAVQVSQNSGYRPKDYEISKGRSGNSQHTFSGYGAADYTAARFDRLVELIIEKTSYTRVCVYPNNFFVHCDYKASGQRQLFEASSPSASWEFVKNL